MVPQDFIDEIKCILGEETDSFLASFDEKPIRSFRINPLKTDIDVFMSKDIKEAIDSKVTWCEYGFYLNDSELSLSVGKHPYHDAGVYYIQEASAMAPVEELDVNPGDRVLDLCASPGGKSTQIAGYLKGEGILISNEINPQRAKILSENIERMGVSNALVLNHSADSLVNKFEGYFNKILVDAPCSGEGMFRKNPEAIDEWSLENVSLCADRQKEILDAAIAMLEYGGRLVFSTCTFSNREDEESVDYVLNTYPEMKLIKMDKLWPHKVKGEGHFLAVFIKGEEKERVEDVLPPCGIEKTINIKEVKDYVDFIKAAISDESRGRFIEGANLLCFGDELYLLPLNSPKMKGLKVLRSGLHLGTLKKNRFEPAHALALFLKPGMVKNEIKVSYDAARAYLHGETIYAEGENGWGLITIDGYSLGWGKMVNGMVKNHYPKGLRTQW